MTRSCSSRSFLGACGAAALLFGCAGTVPTPKSGGDASDANPLGPSYVLIAVPNDDDALLGRVLAAPPQPGRSLEESTRPNPCADKLSEPKTVAMAGTFEDAQDVSVGANVRAMLGAFGFSGDADRATHFLYKLETSKRIARADTADYAACCVAKGCGYAYVSALVYGDGEYSTGEESGATGGANVAGVGGAGGYARMRVLHRRKVKGWIAAIVTVTDADRGALDPLGVAKKAGIEEESVPATVKQLYDRDKVSVVADNGGYRFVDGRGTTLTENEFVRRYRAVTGSDELDPIEQRRNKTSFGIAAVGTVASVGAIVAGALVGATRPCETTDSGAKGCILTGSPPTSADGTTSDGLGVGLLTVGVLGTIGFGTALLLTRDPNGTPTDHYLTDRSATLYVHRYNRALLRSTVRDVETSRRRGVVELRPILGAGGIGLSGRF